MLDHVGYWTFTLRHVHGCRINDSNELHALRYIRSGVEESAPVFRSLINPRRLRRQRSSLPGQVRRLSLSQHGSGSLRTPETFSDPLLVPLSMNPHPCLQEALR
jgi:hypothetical protein